MTHYVPCRILVDRWPVSSNRTSLRVASTLASMLLLAAATGLAAQVRLPLPWTPVPITFQTMVVLFGGLALGQRKGAGVQLLYIGLGVAGVPWFSNWTGGFSHLLGPTGGYLLGFVAVAYCAGYLRNSWAQNRPTLTKMVALLLLLNLVLIHGLGLTQLVLWLHSTEALPTGPYGLLCMSTLPVSYTHLRAHET